MRGRILGMLTLALCFSTQAFAKKAPEFSLKDLNGKEHSLKDYKGKYLVLEWTNPDCPFVVDHYERKTMETTYNKYKDKNVAWLTINSTHYMADNKDSKAWSDKQKLAYPLLNDADGVVGKKYGAETTPHMYVINPEGHIIYDGAIDDDKTNEKKNKINYVDQALSEALAKKKITTAKTKAYGCTVKYKIQS